jgi:hypothetical protein
MLSPGLQDKSVDYDGERVKEQFFVPAVVCNSADLCYTMMREIDFLFRVYFYKVHHISRYIGYP